MVINMTEKTKGHYEASGYIWDEGEVPECEYCGKQATMTTPTSGVHLCDESECACTYVSDNADPIEFVEPEEEGAVE